MFQGSRAELPWAVHALKSYWEQTLRSAGVKWAGLWTFTSFQPPKPPATQPKNPPPRSYTWSRATLGDKPHTQQYLCPCAAQEHSQVLLGAKKAQKVSKTGSSPLKSSEPPTPLEAAEPLHLAASVNHWHTARTGAGSQSHPKVNCNNLFLLGDHAPLLSKISLKGTKNVPKCFLLKDCSQWEGQLSRAVLEKRENFLMPFQKNSTGRKAIQS